MTLDDLASPTWWATAVGGAIVLKVAADYVRLAIEKIASKCFAKLSMLSAKQQQDFAEKVKALRESANLRELYFQRETRQRGRATFFAVCSTLVYVALAMLRLFDRLAVLPHRSYPYPYFTADLKYLVPIVALFGLTLSFIAWSAFIRASSIALLLEEAAIPESVPLELGEPAA